MSIEYYKIPQTDLSLYTLQVGNYRIEPTQLYTGDWIISSIALDQAFIPTTTVEKTKSYDYWIAVDPRWFKSTYESIQALQPYDNGEDDKLTQEEIDAIKASIPPIPMPNSRNLLVQWIWNPIVRLWNQWFG